MFNRDCYLRQKGKSLMLQTINASEIIALCFEMCKKHQKFQKIPEIYILRVDITITTRSSGRLQNSRNVE